MGTSFAASTRILSTLISENPFMASSCFFGVKATDSIVKSPADLSFAMSPVLNPNCYFINYL
jgi:hypothetical protein